MRCPRCQHENAADAAFCGECGTRLTTLLRERSLLATTLVACLLPPTVPEGHMLRDWLDTWSGVGHVLDAMTAAGYHAELRQSVFGWRAEFHREAMLHSRSTRAGVGTAVLPWRAVQMGALDVLKRAAQREQPDGQ
jgi:hypothetical protein